MCWKVLKKIFKIIAKYTPGNKVRCFFLRKAGYVIGEKVYIGEDLLIIDELDDRGRVKIGDRVAIAERVTLVISSYPNFSRIKSYVKNKHGMIEISDDAWLGTGSIILPDVKIGQGAVVGAGAVVMNDVADYTIVGGIPARELKKIQRTNIN